MIRGSGNSSEEGNDNPFQYSCLENHGQRRLASYSPWCCKELDMTEVTQHTCTHVYYILTVKMPTLVLEITRTAKVILGTHTSLVKLISSRLF